MSSTVLTECLVCGGTDLSSIVDFGNQPLANSFISNKNEVLETYPLVLNYCNDCTHCQLSHIVDPTFLFDHYLYVSGTTQTLKNHFNNIALNIYSLKNIKEKKNLFSVRILDIGSNDNTFLNVLKDYGFRQLYGVDPASNINKTNAEGLDIFTSYWSKDFAQKFLVPNKYIFDVVTAFNVFAHNKNPKDFMNGINAVLADDGVAILQFPLFESSLNIKDFGQIYHEHINYFNFYSFERLMSECNFNIINFNFYNDIHGGTAEFTVQRKKQFNKSKIQKSDLKSFEDNVFKNIEQLNNIIEQEYQSGATVVAYGASAKSSTLFNISRLTHRDKISAVIDDNSIKVGRFCPGSNIPVVSSSYLNDQENLVIIITAHNFKDEIISRLQSKNIHAKIISYIPEVIQEII